MRQSKKLYQLKYIIFKKLDLTFGQELRLYKFKKLFFKFGWIFKKKYIFINCFYLLFLIRKGLRFLILHQSLNKRIKNLQLILSIAVLLYNWYKSNNIFLFPFIYYKKLIKFLHKNFRKLKLKIFLLKDFNLLVKRWYLII